MITLQSYDKMKVLDWKYDVLFAKIRCCFLFDLLVLAFSFNL